MNASTDRHVMLRRFQQTIRARKGILAAGDGFTVALHMSGRLLYSGSNRRGQAPDETVSDILALHAEGDSVLALHSDGTVYSAGRSDEEAAFAGRLSCIRVLSLGAHHMAALPGNGHACIGGKMHRGSEEISDWPVVVDVACGRDFTAGLLEDGRVLIACSSRLMKHTVSNWPRIAGIFADVKSNVLYGITDEGRLVSTSVLHVHTREWRNLIYVAASPYALCAVTASGQLLSTGKLSESMTEEKSFVACAVGDGHIVAVTRDGCLHACGDNRFGQCKTASMGQVFSRFDEFGVRRREREAELDATERAYQLRHAEAIRFGGHLACGERLTACVTAYGRALTSSGISGGKVWNDVQQLSCGNAHVLALCTNGRVLADGNPVGGKGTGCCDVGDWTNVRAVTAGSYHSLGVTYDGRVYFCGTNEYGQGDVSDWSDMRLVRTTDTYTVGLTYSGRVRVAGLPPFDPFLPDCPEGRVIDVRVAPTHILCLFSDGRAFATLPLHVAEGKAAEDPAVADWSHVRAIAAAPHMSIGLRYGGTVCAVGYDAAMQDINREISSWRGIVAVGCGSGYVAGLGADGRLRIAGSPVSVRKCHTDKLLPHMPTDPPMQTSFAEASNWQDIIAFSCGPSHLVAINRDGQVLACGSDSDGQCSVTAHFTLFRDARALAGYGQYRKATDGDEDAEP